ncbi:MAG: hypothetical protein ACLP2F_08655 [Steroidobacteraceae bacterium]
MNEIFELWSLPWHALQRSLANGFGAAGTTVSAPANPVCTGARIAGTPVAGARASSWLVRALNASGEPPQVNR